MTTYPDLPFLCRLCCLSVTFLFYLPTAELLSLMCFCCLSSTLLYCLCCLLTAEFLDLTCLCCLLASRRPDQQLLLYLLCLFKSTILRLPNGPVPMTDSTVQFPLCVYHRPFHCLFSLSAVRCEESVKARRGGWVRCCYPFGRGHG
ncbi:hypothetical protein EDD21DRAFT_232309 [Dissophora ornata]|nr:hypothetical protein EDD21DRAFT_232309 [Dissophora ornata]